MTKMIKTNNLNDQKMERNVKKKFKMTKELSKQTVPNDQNKLLKTIKNCEKSSKYQNNQFKMNKTRSK